MAAINADKTLPHLPFQKENRSSPLQLSLVELFAETLLSRAHLAFFMSAYDGTEAQQDSIHQGKAALEEAERLCMLGEQTANKYLTARCWYLRGFLADICGEDIHAAKYFQQAVELDESYARLERVRWHLQRLEDAEAPDDMWDAASFAGSGPELEAQSPGKGDAEEHSDMWDAASSSSSGDQKSPNSPQRDCHPSLSAIGSQDRNRHSVLYGQLMRDVVQTRSKPQPRDTSSLPPPSTTSRPIAWNSPDSTWSGSSGRLDMDAIIEELKNTPAQTRKASQSTKALLELKDPYRTKPLSGLGNPLPAKGNPLPAKDQQDAKKNRDDISRLAAMVERTKEDRLERDRAIQEALAGLTGPRPVGEETLLSDTPSVSELDPTAGAPQHAVRPLKLHVVTTTNGGSSASYALSPTSPSPLRDVFVPDDDVDERLSSK